MRSRRRLCSRAAALFALTLPATALLAQTVARAPVLPALDGWKLSSVGRSYGPLDLYEYVDGAAELYLSLGFESLDVGEYTDGRGGSAVVEIYRHESPLHAFGIYSQERPREGQYIDVGAEGYLASPYLNFVIGDAYVKLSADGLGGRTPEVLRAFARAVVSRIGGPATLPAALGLFPADGKGARSERFAARDILGHEFLHSGFTAEYTAEGQHFRIFIIREKTAHDARETLRRYLEHAGMAADAPREGVHTIADKYNGEIALLWRDRTLCGVVGLAGGPLRERYVRTLDEAVTRQP